MLLPMRGGSAPPLHVVLPQELEERRHSWDVHAAEAHVGQVQSHGDVPPGVQARVAA